LAAAVTASASLAWAAARSWVRAWLAVSAALAASAELRVFQKAATSLLVAWAAFALAATSLLARMASIWASRSFIHWTWVGEGSSEAWRESARAAPAKTRAKRFIGDASQFEVPWRDQVD